MNPHAKAWAALLSGAALTSAVIVTDAITSSYGLVLYGTGFAFVLLGWIGLADIYAKEKGMTTTPTQTTRWRSQDELDAVKAYAKDQGETFSGFIRRLALEAAGLPDDEPESAAAGRRMRAGVKDPWGVKAATEGAGAEGEDAKEETEDHG